MSVSVICVPGHPWSNELPSSVKLQSLQEREQGFPPRRLLVQFLGTKTTPSQAWPGW